MAPFKLSCTFYCLIDVFLRQLEKELTQLPSLTKTAAKNLAQMGISNVAQLLTHYPSHYLDRRKRQPLVAAGGLCNNVVLLKSCQKLPFSRYKNQSKSVKSLFKVVVEDGAVRGSLLCYNRPFLAKNLKVGQYYFLSAHFQRRYGELQTSQFEIETYSRQPKLFNRILPVYRLSGRLRQQQLRNWIAFLLEEHLEELEDELPVYLRRKNAILDKKQALKQIHLPQDEKELEYARYSLAYEEFFRLVLAIHYRSSQRKQRKKRALPLNWQKKITLQQPFELTKEQKQVLQEIHDDLQQDSPMRRLLQGDVGCGKTIVALLSALPMLEQGFKVALMAPTDVLARQIYEVAKKLLSDLDCDVFYVSGQLKVSERKAVMQQLEECEAAFIAGTHALFSQKLELSNLGYVIIDEQQRFGVMQRLAIQQKGEQPDLLLMSATPIPRSLALSFYGDLTQSLIKQRPRSHRDVVTYLAEDRSLERVYSFVEEELKKGRQAYFIYPLVNIKSSRRSVEEMLSKIAQRFKNYHVAALHGQLKTDVKQQIMNDFCAQRYHILVASTVIEVGVDVANATIMVIDDAANFGLAQLHQLRGRVGRSDLQSYCFLIYKQGLGSEAIERLKILKGINDGFLIAEEDFKKRGPGDLLGLRQSGYPALYLANLERDTQLLEQVRCDVLALLKIDAQLQQHTHSSLMAAYAEQLQSEEQALDSG